MTDPNPDNAPLLSPPSTEDVLAAAEQLRATDYADVPAELLTAVLTAEQDNLDDRTGAARTVDQVINAYLGGGG